MPIVQTKSASIYYETRGEGEPILFIHGSGGSWKFWQPQIEFFSSRYKMIMIDLRGHGQSTKEFPNGEYSIHVLAEDVKRFLDALGIENISIIGLSQGAVVAGLFATKYPDYIKKLVIVNGYSEMPSAGAEWLLKISNTIFSLLPYSLIEKLVLLPYGNDEYTKSVIRSSLTIDKKMLLAMKKSAFPNHTKGLRNISSPVLILAGDKKNVGPEVKGAQLYFDHLPHPTVAIFKDAFDPISTMRRDIFNEMVHNFLSHQELRDYQGVTYWKKSD